MSSLALVGSTATGVLHGGLVWRGDRLATGQGPVRPTGFAALDAELPGGGWPANALIELLADRPGIGELSLLLPLMREVAAGRWLVWVAPPLSPYAPALAAAGVPLARLLLVDPPRPEQSLWAARQALASGSCAASSLSMRLRFCSALSFESNLAITASPALQYISRARSASWRAIAYITCACICGVRSTSFSSSCSAPTDFPNDCSSFACSARMLPWGSVD